MQTPVIRVGTASWADPEFVRDWYPPGLRAADRLRWYADHFDLVEVNTTFYGVPTERDALRWVRETPPGFTFDVKLHRLLSRHAAGPESLPRSAPLGAARGPRGRVTLTPELEQWLVEAFFRALEPLVAAERMGALLLQLTPSFAPHPEALAALEPLAAQVRAAGHRLAVELRHAGWAREPWRSEARAALQSWGAAWVGVDAPASDGRHPTIFPRLDEVTSPALAYLRLHGRDAHAYLTGRTVAERFFYRYNAAELAEVRDRSVDLAARAKEVHVIFNNNARDFAPQNAQELLRLLGQEKSSTGAEEQPELFG
ncbi:MAG: DUF72 domain-containing protein [Verrucomicrobia bacterium]|nr:DUF72 domain-containing protein [Verrucomicrobiota bacterium]